MTPRAVWREARDGDDLAARIKKLPGFGDMKVKILVAVLAKKFGVKPHGLGEARRELAHGGRRRLRGVDGGGSRGQARDEGEGEAEKLLSVI